MTALKLFAPMLALVATLTSATAETTPPTLFWDWGGDKQVDGSGREVVRLAKPLRPGQIIVSFSDRKLYLATDALTAITYPIAVPREDSRWQGQTSVTDMRVNPSWTPTPSMLAKNPKLPRWVPGGHPLNPLGERALYLGSSAYRIHGTDAPWTIGSAASSGCVRLYNKDVADLYVRVRVGAKVLVTWEKFKSTVDETATAALAKAPAVAIDVKTKARSIETGTLPTPKVQLRPAEPLRTPIAPPEKLKVNPKDDGPLWI